MSIKNFTVTSQRVKNKSDGLIKYIQYLENENEPSHKNTSILYFNGGSAGSKKTSMFLTNTIQEVIAFDNKNTKGGRKVESFAQSFDFVLPPTVAKPTLEQWELIAKDIFKATHKHLNIQDSIGNFANSCYANVHDQKNPHLNLVIPRIYNGERLHKLDQKALIGAVKKEFNASVLKHCQIDFKQYKPDRQNVGPRRAGWQRDQQKAKEMQEKAAIESELAREAKAKADQATAKAEKAKADAEKAQAEAEKSIGALKIMKSLMVYFMAGLESWVDAVLNDDKALKQETEKEIEDTTYNILSNDSYSETDQELMEMALGVAENQTAKHLPENEEPMPSRVRRRIRNYFPE